MDADVAKRYGVTDVEMDGLLRGVMGFTPHMCAVEAQMTMYTDDGR